MAAQHKLSPDDVWVVSQVAFPERMRHHYCIGRFPHRFGSECAAPHYFNAEHREVVGTHHLAEQPHGVAALIQHEIVDAIT